MRVERARYLLAAVETGSLRAAAERCGVSQPTLGEQVSLLEEELDVVLLTRSRRGVRPTAAGQAMIEPLTRLVAAEDAALRTAADSGGAYQGRVAIGAISVVAETLVAPVVARLRQEHADLRFSVIEASSGDIESRVLGGDLDFGVITAPAAPAAGGLRRSPLLRVPVGAVVHRDHLLTRRSELVWDDLATWPIVTMRAGTVMWERLQENVADPDVVVQAMSARLVKVMVRHGAGIGVLAPFETSTDVDGLRWIPIRGAEPVDICLVQRGSSRPSPSALIVRRLVEERAAELLGGAEDVTGGSGDPR
ncbi:LysR family transcriptional regulator [Streptomonospora alba]|uniref:LysR family transcriptional regulator n=1 Tax=Streptomonospora alba TaxID=183763 RepID=UPI00069C4F51|nr:LysR family transcriptional regulator [Streptomonospora alba]